MIAERRIRVESGETVEQEEQRRLAVSRLVVSDP
jgi:hypothetical protein